MKLYRIRNKQTGKFFGGLAYPWIKAGHEIWNDKGAMYRDIDTIENWLRVICSDWRNPKWPPYTCRGHWTAKKLLKVLDDFDHKKLKKYEVVVNNVTLRGQKIIEAKDLVKK